MTMKVKIKKSNPNAVIPSYAKPGDAGLDLTAISAYYDEEEDCIVYNTGLQIEIPEGYVGLLYPRSSIADRDILLSNSVGVIDSGYRGDIKLKFALTPSYTSCDVDLVNECLYSEYAELPFKDGDENSYVYAYSVGERVAQLIIMPIPTIELEESKELSNTERGAGGYGSSGK